MGPRHSDTPRRFEARARGVGWGPTPVIFDDTEKSLAFERAGIAPPGYRLPDGARVGRVRLQVADLERSLAFYQSVVGFRVIDRGEGQARLGAFESDAVLLELTEKLGVRSVPRRGLLGLYHFAVLLPNRPALGAFIAHLGQTRVQVGMADHSYSQSIYLYDPDGLGVEVYADQPRETWVVRDGQYVGTVDPLDVGALVQLAGDTVWAGLPVVPRSATFISTSATSIGRRRSITSDLASIRPEVFLGRCSWPPAAIITTSD